MKKSNRLDSFALLLNRELLKSDSPVVGIWYGISEETETSDIILKFLENGKFIIEGSFYAAKENKLDYGSNECFIMDNMIKFHGNGIYSVNKDKIKMKGNIDIEQIAYCKKDSGKSNLKYDESIKENYVKLIDFNGKYYRTVEGDIVRLQLKNKKGIINFKDKIFNGECSVKGFRSFTEVVEIRAI